MSKRGRDNSLTFTRQVPKFLVAMGAKAPQNNEPSTKVDVTLEDREDNEDEKPVIVELNNSELQLVNKKSKTAGSLRLKGEEVTMVPKEEQEQKEQDDAPMEQKVGTLGRRKKQNKKRVEKTKKKSGKRKKVALSFDFDDGN